MMLFWYMKAIVQSPDGNTEFFDIVAGVLLRDTLPLIYVYNLRRLCTSNLNKSNKENSCTFKKIRSWRYSAETIIDTDYPDYLALLTNTPAQAKSLLHSL